MLPQYFFLGKIFSYQLKIFLWFYSFRQNNIDKILLWNWQKPIAGQNIISPLPVIFLPLLGSLCDSLSNFSRIRRQEANQADLKLVTLIILANSVTKQVARLPCHLLPQFREQLLLNQYLSNSYILYSVPKILLFKSKLNI